jgi:hypothetical protein
VAPSAVKSRIGRYMPNELDEAGIEKQIADFANCAAMARLAGYDGVEIIGSAGYLISTFLVQKTNLRTDRWGGSWENRMRFPRRGGEACARRRRGRLHRDLPHRRDGHARRRPGLGRGGLAGAGRGGRRRQHHQHPLLLARSAGADHRHHGAARRLRAASRAGCASTCACR